MVNQINPRSSVATDVAPGALIAVKSVPNPEKNRLSHLPEGEEPLSTQVKPSAVPSSKDLDAAVQEVDEHLKQSGSTLQIDYDKTSGRNVFKVVDSATGGVVFQIPSEEILAAARKLRQTANAQNTSGVLVDKEG
jgi:uncharacterized FlaG/YvyC family protein